MTRSTPARAFRTPAAIIVSMVRPKSLSSDWSAFASVRTGPRFTAMTTSAPMARVTSPGTLFRAPPSTSSHWPYSTGVKTPGMAIVARRAVASGPRPRTTESAVRRSVATQRNGVGRSSKLSMSAYASAMRSSSSMTCWPGFSPPGSMKPCFSPNSSWVGKARRSCFRRNSLCLNGESARNITSQSALRIIVRSSPGDIPVAYPPPMRAPALVPAIASTGMRCSSSHSRTPMWARPRALPPPRARPMRGRAGAGGAPAGAARPGAARQARTRAAQRPRRIGALVMNGGWPRGRLAIGMPAVPRGTLP